jgi:hypothetical protein
MRQLTIRQRKWLHYRKGGPAGELLELETGRMCCLGFLGIACGALPDELAGRALPASIHPDPSFKWPKGMTRRWVARAVHVNDSPVVNRKHIALAERKQLLKTHFAKIGFRLKFT